MRKYRSRDLMAAVMLTVMGVLVGCQDSTSSADKKVVKTMRSIDSAQVARGKALFAQHCARCHGDMAQGDPQWRTRNADGTFPPPPLNGTGHAWHHPHVWLKEMIRDGSAPQGNMPAWGSTLNDQQMEDLIAWFQSLWPDEVYAAWSEMDQRSRAFTQQ